MEKKAKSLKLDLNRFFVVIFFFHFFWYVLYIKKNFFLQNVISKDLWRNHWIFILGRMMICGRGKNCFLFSRKNGIRSFKLGTHFLNNQLLLLFCCVSNWSKNLQDGWYSLVQLYFSLTKKKIKFACKSLEEEIILLHSQEMLFLEARKLCYKV